jgi:ferritin-like metal-binding protein YciE
MPKKEEGLQDLFVEELRDLLDAEKQLVRALPAMAKAVSDEELATALREHLEVTRGHVDRLGRVFEALDRKPTARACKGMRGIVEEGRHIVQQEKGQPVKDTAIAGSARKVEHYEMAGYQNACALARQLGMNDAAGLLQQTLDEEVEADRQLAKLAGRLAGEVPQTRDEPMQMATRG